MTARKLQELSQSEVRKWARLLIAQYGADAEDLAEIGVIEMLAIKNPSALVAWARIYAAILEIRSNADEACGPLVPLNAAPSRVHRMPPARASGHRKS